MKNFSPALTFYVLLFVGINAFGQTRVVSFEIEQETGKFSQYQSALEKANLETYRLRDAERSLRFEDGTLFTLISAEKLVFLGCELSLDDYPVSKNINSAVSLIFAMSSDGRLSVRSEIDPKSKLAQIGKGFSAHPRQIISKSDFGNMSNSLSFTLSTSSLTKPTPIFFDSYLTFS